MNKITYLFFHSDHPLHLIGENSGAENATLELTKALAKNDHRVIVCAYLVDSDECTKDGVEFWNFGKNYDIASIFERAKTLESYILITACRGLPILISKNQENCLRRYLICHEPSGGAFGVKTSIISEIADGIICVSNAQKQLLLDEGAREEKIKVIYNGVNLERFTVGNLEKRDFKQIVFVGALVYHKGVDILIEAFASLLNKHKDIKLDIYGSASLWGKEEYINSKKISDSIPNITFHGAVGQDEIASVFKKAGLCVIPSRLFDSFPLTAVEAQVSGCPVVCFNVGGIPECVENGKSGVVIDNISAQSLASTLDMLLSNNEYLKKFSEYASLNFRQKYNWDNTSKEVDKFILEDFKEVPSQTSSLKTLQSLADDLKNKKIGFLTTWNQPCGIAKYASMLLKEFKDENITILAEDNKDADVGSDEQNVIRCWNRALSDYSKLATVIKNEKIDILYIYFHAFILKETNLSKLLKELKETIGLKIVLECHNTQKGNVDIDVSIIDRFIVHSEQNKIQLSSFGVDPSLISVVSLGLREIPKISTQKREEIRKELNVKNDEKLLLSFGFIQAHKGMETVIEGVAYCLKKNIKVKGVIIGSTRKDDPYSQRYLNTLKALIDKYEVKDYVTLIDSFVSDEKLNQYIQSADIVYLNYKSPYFESSGAANLALSNGAVLVTSLAPMFTSYADCTFKMTMGFDSGEVAEYLIKNDNICEYLRENSLKFIKSNSFEIASNNIKSVLKGLSTKNNKSFISDNKLDYVKNQKGIVMDNNMAHKKKILFVNRDNAFTQRGGDTVLMERLKESLEKEGYIIDMCTDRYGANFKDYDLIHIFNFAITQVATDAGIKAYRLGVPFVVTTLFEDVERFYNQSIAVSKFFIAYQQSGQNEDFFRNSKMYIDMIPTSSRFDVSWLCEHANALLTSGKLETANLKRIYNPKARIFETHFGLNMTLEGNKDRFYEKYGIKDFVFCVGRFETRKNQLMLLKALEKVDLPLVFASGGFTYQPDYSDAVKNFKRVGETKVLDKLPLQDLADAYAACKVHVLPSFYELPGLVSLEAAYYGANVVVTDEGSIRDYLKDEAFYCSPYSSDSIKNAVIAAYYAPVRKELKELVSTFSWERCAKETIYAYDQVFSSLEKNNDKSINVESNIKQDDLQCKQEIASQNVTQNVTQNAAQNATQSENINEDKYSSNMQTRDYANETSLVKECAIETPFTKEEEEKFQEGMRYANMNQLDKALEIYHALEFETRGSSRLFRNIGAIVLAQNNVQDAKSYFERALCYDSEDVNAIKGLGICLMRQNDFDGAIKIFEKALSVDPYEMMAILKLMECAYAVNKFDSIKSALKTYLTKNPSDVGMQFSYVGICYKLNEFNEAKQCLAKVKELNSKYDGIREMQEKIDEAISNIALSNSNNQAYKTEIIQDSNQDFLNPSYDNEDLTNDNLKNSYANMNNTSYNASCSFNSIDSIDSKIADLEDLKKRKMYDEFEKGIDELISNSSLNAEHREYVNILKAESLMIKGDNNSSLEILEQVIQKNPSSYKAISDLGILLATKGNWSDAKEKFNLALSINPKYDVALSGLGLCYNEEGDNEAAFNYYMKSLEVNAENTRAIFGIIDLSYKLSRLDALEQVLNNYLELHPADLNFLYSLATCYYGKSEFEKSLAVISKIFLFDSNNKNATELKNLIESRMQEKNNFQTR